MRWYDCDTTCVLDRRVCLHRSAFLRTMFSSTTWRTSAASCRHPSPTTRTQPQPQPLTRSCTLHSGTFWLFCGRPASTPTSGGTRGWRRRWWDDWKMLGWGMTRWRIGLLRRVRVLLLPLLTYRWIGMPSCQVGAPLSMMICRPVIAFCYLFLYLFIIYCAFRYVVS